MPLEGIEPEPADGYSIVFEACEELSSIWTMEELAGAFGIPLEDVSRSVANPYVNGQVDEWHDARFAHAEAGYLVSDTATRPIMVHYLRITSREASSGIYQLIGQSVTEAITRLGTPNGQPENGLVYFCGEVNSIRLEILDDAISAVIWQPYTG